MNIQAEPAFRDHWHKPAYSVPSYPSLVLEVVEPVCLRLITPESLMSCCNVLAAGIFIVLVGEPIRSEIEFLDPITDRLWMFPNIVAKIWQ